MIDLSGVTKPNGKIKQIAETKTVSAIFVMSLSGRIKHIVGQRIFPVGGEDVGV